MSEPPDDVVNAAIRIARLSPCAKSKRGVVIFDSKRTDGQYAAGFNGPPEPLTCDASDFCRRDCSKICIHAEDMAIGSAREKLPFNSDFGLANQTLVHVKVDGGMLVPGGGPSCWQCSRLVLDSGLEAVWLFEMAYNSDDQGVWRRYTAIEFHTETLKACGLHLGEKLR